MSGPFGKAVLGERAGLPSLRVGCLWIRKGEKKKRFFPKEAKGKKAGYVGSLVMLYKKG